MCVSAHIFVYASMYNAVFHKEVWTLYNLKIVVTVQPHYIFICHCLFEKKRSRECMVDVASRVLKSQQNPRYNGWWQICNVAVVQCCVQVPIILVKLITKPILSGVVVISLLSLSQQLKWLATWPALHKNPCRFLFALPDTAMQSQSIIRLSPLLINNVMG